MERAFYAALAAVEAKQSVSAFDDVKDLEAVLRGKLIEIVQTNSFSDAEALQDVLLDRPKLVLSRTEPRGARSSAEFEALGPTSW